MADKSETARVVTSVAKIGVAGVFIALCAKFLPLVEMLYLFAMIVVIPVGVLAAVGIITGETFNLLTAPINGFVNQVRTRAQEMAAAAEAERAVG